MFFLAIPSEEEMFPGDATWTQELSETTLKLIDQLWFSKSPKKKNGPRGFFFLFIFPV
jgi:hypothetical protein